MKKKQNYGKMYYLFNKNKRMVAGIIGGLLAFIMVASAIISAII